MGPKLENEQRFDAWQIVCEQILARPFPPQESDFPAEELERDARLTFTHLSNWEIICQEILDTQFSHIYYQRCLDELRRRGKSDEDILNMRRLAWLTAGWFNFPMMGWDWVSLDQSDILRAIEWLYDYDEINRETREEMERLVWLHA